MSDNIEFINSSLMMCFEHMLDSELKLSRFESAVKESGLVDVNLPDLNLLDKALNVMGFPEDNSAKFFSSENPGCYDHPDCFCRDWIYEKWFEVCDGKIDIRDFILWAHIEVRAFA